MPVPLWSRATRTSAYASGGVRAIFDMKTKPSPTESYGRDGAGRFAAGNKCARGNPYAKQVQKLRSALLSAVKPSDVRAIMQKLIARAREGDIVAVKEVLDRCIGRPIEADLLDQLSHLEHIVDELEKSNR